MLDAAIGGGGAQCAPQAGRGAACIVERGGPAAPVPERARGCSDTEGMGGAVGAVESKPAD
jgi:hypothetical protein